MKQLLEWLAFAVFLVVLTNIARAQRSQPAAPRVVDLKSTDGTVRKGAFYTLRSPVRASCSLPAGELSPLDDQAR